jgi:hypothetical protein
MALSFIENGSALYYKEKIMPDKEEKEVDSDYKEEEKYVQLEFEFDEDLVAPI